MKPIWAVFTLIVISLAMGLTYIGYNQYKASLLAAVPAVTYDGEFDDGFLATDGWFTTSFTEGTDCNITDDVLGGSTWATSCVYETSTALNATANAHMVVDIDGPVEAIDIDFDMGAGSQTTGVPTDDIDLVDAKIYTHEDDPKLIYDLSGYIEDVEDLDATGLGPLAKGEYVIWLKFHTKTISPAFTDGDDIGRLTIELDTSEDVDKAQITLESG